MTATITLPAPTTAVSGDLTPTPPDRTLEQRWTALDRANDVRSYRAQLKRDLKAGRVDFLDLLRDPPEMLLTAKVYEILLSVPKIGRVRVTKAFNRHTIAPSKTFEGLSDRQRKALIGDATLPTAMAPWGTRP